MYTLLATNGAIGIARVAAPPTTHRHPLVRDQLATASTRTCWLYPVMAERRALGALLFRNDDSFIWRVGSARPMTAEEFEMWLGSTSDE